MLLKMDIVIRKDKNFQRLHDEILQLPNYREYVKDKKAHCEITIETAYDFLLFYDDLAELYKRVIRWKSAEIWVMDRYIEKPLRIFFGEIEAYVRNRYNGLPSQTVLGQIYEQWLLKL